MTLTKIHVFFHYFSYFVPQFILSYITGIMMQRWIAQLIAYVAYIMLCLVYIP